MRPPQRYAPHAKLIWPSWHPAFGTYSREKCGTSIHAAAYARMKAVEEHNKQQAEEQDG